MFLAVNSLLAQNYTLKGKILDSESKEPLAGATVQLKNTFIAGSTRSDGYFSFDNLKTGIYIVKISFVGYETLENEVQLNSNVNLVFNLSRNVITTEEVLISGLRADDRTPSTKQNINRETLAALSYGQDLPMLLSLTPSLVSTSDAGAGIGYTSMRIRGTDISRINVTLNGVPVNDPESHGVFWVNMPDLSSSVDNIQIQRGVGTSANGAAAFGASINIQTTKLNPTPFAEIRSNAGSFNSLSNSVSFGTGLIDNKWSFDGRLSKISSDGFIDRATSDLKSYFFNAAYYSEKNIFRLTIMGGSEKTYQAWNGIPKARLNSDSADMARYLNHGLYSQIQYDQMIESNPRTYNLYTYDNETDNYNQYHYHLNFMRQQNAKLSFNATAFLVAGNGYYEQYKARRRFSAYGLSSPIIGSDTIKRTDVIQQKHLDNLFYGLNLATHYNSLNKLKISSGVSINHYTNDHFGNIIWMQYAASTPKDYQWYFNNGKKTDLSAYVRSNYQINEKLSLYGDVLYRNIEYKMDGIHDDLRDITQSHVFNFVNPKGGIFYTLNNSNEFYTSVAVAGREPSRNNFRDADENSDVKPEMLINYEAGYYLKLKKMLLNANIFYMDYKDQLVMTGKINNVGDPMMVNVPESFRVGIEVLTTVKVHAKLEIDANLSLSRNKIKEFTEYVDNWDTWGQDQKVLNNTDISFSPSVISAAQIRFMPLTDLTLAFNSKYVSKQYIDNTSSDRRMIDAWYASDLKIGYKLPKSFLKDAEINFNIINLFNSSYETNAWVYRYVYEGKEYEMDGYFPHAGRHFMIGTRIRF